MKAFKKVFAVFFALFFALPALAQEYPQTFEHRFGTAVLEAKPQRVVSLSYSGHDDLLALGVKPVAIRYWYGDYPFGIWPWAQEALGDHEPVVLEGELNIEKIASLNPDLIVGLSSGMTEAEYELLSQIAPTIAAEADYSDYGTPWDVGVATLGRAVGEEKLAASLVSDIKSRLAEVAEAHPEWEGKSAAVAFVYDGAPGAFRSIDTRASLLGSLGFVTPKEIDAAAAEDAFWTALSAEDLSPLETDLIIWTTSSDDFTELKTLTLRKSLTAHKEGREILANPLLSGAFSHSSLLSLSYVLDELVPLIELAVDGDPETVVPSTKAAGLLD